MGPVNPTSEKTAFFNYSQEALKTAIDELVANPSSKLRAVAKKI